MYKLIEVVIKPVTAFATPLKGDTIFGQFFWQVVYDTSLVKENLGKLMEIYNETPFVIFSSACYKKENGWLFPRPSLPLHFFGEEEDTDCFVSSSKRKERKRKKFIYVGQNLVVEGKEENLINQESMKVLKRVRNSINRKTFTTGEGFAPYEVEEIWYYPEIKISIFCLYLEEFVSVESIKIAFERIGKFGFGKDASLGLGKFEVEEVKDLTLPEIGRLGYTLSPCVPKEEEVEIERSWFSPFIRFGKHGGEFAISRNPFKEPIIMADEGAIFELKEEKIKTELPFIGQGIKGGSKVCKELITQAFSIILPVRLKDYEA